MSPFLAPKGTLMSVDQFKQFAAYNKWANGTLNHLLLTDRLWLKRLTGLHNAPFGFVCYASAAATAATKFASAGR